ncbi:MAG: tape measure protein [Rhodospirillales bacterium]|jgi:phage tail tape-measure protein|nr:tape measure protein [Rhodospirillales bacterium]
MSSLDVSVVIRAIDRATAPLRRINQAMGAVAEPSRRVGSALSSVGREAGALGIKLAALTGGAGYLFKTMFVDTAAQFERYRTILEQLEGSAESASKAMDWASDFATTTPYELDQVMEAFVKLRSYGMEPMNGLLRTLGDTSAAMGKPLMQAVEAMADAVTGENERLKEFGIRARQVGSRIVYEYTVNGQTMRKAAKANSREQIQAVLASIWNEKYSGAMGKLSKTWEGMISNISDQWTRFTNLVMEAGVFEWLKSRLEMVLSTIDAWASDGRLLAWAQQLGSTLTAAFDRVWTILPDVWNGLQQVGRAIAWLADIVGGWRNLIIIAAAVVAGPLLMAIGQLGVALANLGLAVAATPVGWFIGAVAAIAGAAYLIYRNWEGIVAWFGGLWDRVLSAIDAGVAAISGVLGAFNPVNIVAGAFNDLVAYITGVDLAALIGPKIRAALDGILPDWVVRAIAGSDAPKLAPPATPIEHKRAEKAEVGGEIVIRLEGAPRGTRVSRLRSANPDVGLDVDLGQMMVTP